MRKLPNAIPQLFRLLTLWAACSLGSGLFGSRPAFAVTALVARNTAFKLQSEAMKLYKDGSYKKAIELLRQVTNLSLNSFLAHYYLGLALSADRQYAEALEPLKIALELEPGHIQAHIALGDAYLKLGDLGEARAEYLRALSSQDSYAPAHDGLGRVYEAQGMTIGPSPNIRKRCRSTWRTPTRTPTSGSCTCAGESWMTPSSYF